MEADEAAAGFATEVQEMMVNDTVKYMLIMDQRKLPIKRGDIKKNVLKEHSRSFNLIMEKAKEKLEQVFGLEVVPLQDKQPMSYILVNCHQAAVGTVDGVEPHVAGSEEDHQRMGLLMVILAAIFINKNVLADAALYNLLKRLGVDIDKLHPVFGMLANTLKDFERQCYLKKSRIPNSDPPTYEYQWGQRAERELSKQNCLDFVTKVYSKDDLSHWTHPCADVQRDEGTAEGEET